MTTEKKLLTMQEIAKYLQVSVWWISKFCNAKFVGAGNVIPHRRIGRKYYFSIEQVDEWNLRRRS